MAPFVVSVLLVLLLVQFLLWTVMEVDVRRTEDTTLQWFAIVAIFPVIGLFVSTWYFSNRLRTVIGSVA
jgi:uncharacterized membrane protein YhaH (DUF805 family)